MADLSEWQQTLGTRFKDPSLLEQALVHSSFINENLGTATASNERLEFLGDSVLGMVIAGELYTRYPQHSEGEMTKMRSVLVRSGTLKSIAESICLGDYIYLGKGEEASGGRHKMANLAGAMESLIAAVFLDQGLEAARDFILRLFGAELDSLSNNSNLIDYKSQLQQLYQPRYKKTPVYRTIETAEVKRNRMFFSEVIIDDKVMGSGYGRNKKNAETAAARSALEQETEDFTR
ncbi:MAG TPA: ribonuclease III [Dehalococcoidia bacterium]|nr:ribonuclease III [Dehalococcoidia bacterium]